MRLGCMAHQRPSAPAGNDGAGAADGVMIDATNLKLHAAADAGGRPTRCFLTAGQTSDDTGPAALPDCLPAGEWLITDRLHDADRFRGSVDGKGRCPCRPGQKSRGKAIRYGKRRYKRHQRIKIMFGKMKVWRRVATRDDTCARTFVLAMPPDATVSFRL